MKLDRAGSTKRIEIEFRESISNGSLTPPVKITFTPAGESVPDYVALCYA